MFIFFTFFYIFYPFFLKFGCNAILALKNQGKNRSFKLTKRHNIYIYTMYKYSISIKCTKIAIYHMAILWLWYGYPTVLVVPA